MASLIEQSILQGDITKEDHILRFNFLFSLIGTIGSLYFSEVMKFPPCVLCWYQRICLYPLVILFGVAIWSDSKDYRKYALPLIAIGLVIAIYHNLLYFGLIAEELAPCTQGVPCNSRQLQLFGFVTIPLLSLLGFLAMGALTFFDQKKETA